MLLQAVVEHALRYGMDKVEIWELDERFVEVPVGYDGICWARGERDGSLSCLNCWGDDGFGSADVSWYCNEKYAWT